VNRRSNDEQEEGYVLVRRPEWDGPTTPIPTVLIDEIMARLTPAAFVVLCAMLVQAYRDPLCPRTWSPRELAAVVYVHPMTAAIALGELAVWGHVRRVRFAGWVVVSEGDLRPPLSLSAAKIRRRAGSWRAEHGGA
jgi:hypothetical protein